MSLWLSGANAMLGSYNNQVRAAVRRQASAATNDSTKRLLALWGLTPLAGARRRRRR
jgi:hypothetical protein